MGKMSERHFNLVSTPWLKVIDENNQGQMVSMEELFTNTRHYRRLAGEMKSQDLAIIRFLLAILTTVYSRFDAHDQSYSWLEIDKKTMKPLAINFQQRRKKKIKNSLMATWEELYRNKSFSEVILDYLHVYSKHFDLFDKDTPFYQVTRDQYDSMVPQNKVVEKGKGTVAIKQINRTISESNNKPDVFSPNAPSHKDDVSLDELARWLITYQNFTAVTDKTKVNSKEKFSVSRGWLYGLNPVFAKGANLFETLMLNLVLAPTFSDLKEKIIRQAPVWEVPVEDYIQTRIDNNFPGNIAQLYTIWSRAIHIEWDGNQPTIFSAGLPKLNNENAFLEPMTTWKLGKKEGDPVKPNLRWLNSLGKAMWRNFGQYVPIHISSSSDSKTEIVPGVVSWLNFLQRNGLIKSDFSIHLATVGLINDGKTSQSPAAEFADEMQINADVLFDDDPVAKIRWPALIENVVQLTIKQGSLLFYFAKSVGELRELGDPGNFANQVTARYYSRLNQPFYEWLAGLKSDDESNTKIKEWRDEARRIVILTASELLNSATPREIRGKMVDDKLENIFIDYRIFRASVAKIWES